MKKQAKLQGLVSLALLALPLFAGAQVPVDENGNVIGAYDTERDASANHATGNEDIPLLAPGELEDLVGPIALYPDDLLAIVLPAASFPLQIIEAARFLEELEQDPTLKPDPEWDDSVVALLNYPEVVTLLNDEIDWTWQLGEAVVAQQADVVSAIESFRDRAYAAGNLKSDDYQTISRDNGVIEITPVAEDVIYVPYYEPERVVVYQPRPVYYYYPRAYPVYYYPYSSSYVFHSGYFWGVTTAFTVGWLTDSLHVYHHSYYGHPYYGRSYWDYWWYRRPSINVYNTTYVHNRSVTVNHYYTGDRWQPRHDRPRRVYTDGQRVVNRHYYNGSQRTEQARITRSVDTREPIRFRERDARTRPSPRNEATERVRDSRERIARQGRDRQVPVASRDRETRSSDRLTTPRRTRDPDRMPTQRAVRRESPPVAQREVRRPSEPTTRRLAQRESRDVTQRQEVRRQSRPVTTRQEVRRESRETPEYRSAPRESRATPEYRSAPRESRATPPRQTVRRESQSRPQRQVRQESRSAPKQKESGRSAPGESRKRSKERHSAR